MESGRLGGDGARSMARVGNRAAGRLARGGRACVRTCELRRQTQTQTLRTVQRHVSSLGGMGVT
eukprot:1387681-Prymnesium_polylepis.1